MRKETIKVKALTYLQPGKKTWITIKTFSTAREADAWLTNYIKTNKAIPTDYTITR